MFNRPTNTDEAKQMANNIVAGAVITYTVVMTVKMVRDIASDAREARRLKKLANEK